MEFTLSLYRIDSPGTTYTLMIEAESAPEKLVDFDGGKAKIAPEHGYEQYLKIRAYAHRDDRIELYSQDAQGKDVVGVTIGEVARPSLEVNAMLNVAMGIEITWATAKIRRRSW